MELKEYISLFEYLGKPAGQQLGREVNLKAQANNIPIQMKEISNPKYTGKVMLYPKSFLDLYFGKQESIFIDNGDELPF